MLHTSHVSRIWCIRKSSELPVYCLVELRTNMPLRQEPVICKSHLLMLVPLKFDVPHRVDRHWSNPCAVLPTLRMNSLLPRADHSSPKPVPKYDHQAHLAHVRRALPWRQMFLK